MDVLDEIENPAQFFQELKKFPSLTPIYVYHQVKEPQNWDKGGPFR